MKRTNSRIHFKTATTALAIFATSVGLSARLTFAQIANRTDAIDRTRAALQLSSVSIQDLIVLPEPDGTYRASVMLGDAATRELELVPVSLRSPDFKVLVQGEDGALRETPPPPAATYRGWLLDDPSSRVAASVIDGRLHAMIETAGERWYMQPADAAVAGAGEPYAVFREQDAVADGLECGNDGESEPPVDDEPFGGAEPRGGGLAATEIAFDADVEYFQSNGSSVTATVNDIELILNTSDALYQPLGIAYIVRRIIVRTAEPDPYSPSGTLTALQMNDEFRDWWVANHTTVPRDVVHLMSNRTSSDGFVGWAFGPVICSQTSGYGWSRPSWGANLGNQAALLAHELGHNWSACHCNQAGCTGGGVDPDCGIMCSNPAGCTAGNTVWGVRATTAILAHLATRTCLSSLLATVYVDVSYAGTEDGTEPQPFNTVREGTWAVLRSGGTVSIEAGSYNERIIIRRPMTLVATNGIVTIGQ